MFAKTEIKIEKNVPIPSRASNDKGTPWKNLAKRMKVGDSVVLNKSEAQSLYQAIKSLKHRSIRRTISKTKVRTWKGGKID